MTVTDKQPLQIKRPLNRLKTALFRLAVLAVLILVLYAIHAEPPVDYGSEQEVLLDLVVLVVVVAGALSLADLVNSILDIGRRINESGENHV